MKNHSLQLTIFRKKDELQIPRIFHQLRLFKNRGCLLFINCETKYVENALIECIENELKQEFEIAHISLSEITFDPFAEIEKYFERRYECLIL